jgi:glutamate N-acetyltransferase/amino-acid N-acetyltransferase
MRAVVINSGNANACTGDRGLTDAKRMAEISGKACGVRPEQVLVLSTGVIGQFLPMDRIEPGIRAASTVLGDSDDSITAYARAMLTTDTVHKVSVRELELNGVTTRITGMAKGAAMIGPNMATMLATLVTDAAVDVSRAQELLTQAVDNTFNCISVEGHMSTNDSVVLLANGAASSQRLSGNALTEFAAALEEVCGELARAIIADGEGATHVITIDVRGCRDRDSARRIAKTVAESALVKAAVAGGDPNWGRIVSAAGYAGVPFDPATVALDLNGQRLFERGGPAEFDEAEAARSLRENREASVVLTFADGLAEVRFWTTDLTAEYVRLNADYRT